MDDKILYDQIIREEKRRVEPIRNDKRRKEKISSVSNSSI